MTEDAEELGTDEALRILLRTLPRVAAGLKRPGVPQPLQVLFTALGPRHIPVLSYLLLDGPMSVGELADRLGLAMPTTSLMVRDLERADLVHRTEDPGDRRRRLVRISEEHRGTVDEWLDRRARPIQAALAQLTAAERGALSHGMRLLADEFDRDAGPMPAT